MSNLIESIKGFFTKKEPLSAGIYNYNTPPESEEQYRLHLRIEQDGSGLLVINASTVLHLNQTAVEYAYYLINGIEPEQVAKIISDRYKVDTAVALKDFEDLKDKIMTLINTPDLDPVTYLGIERQTPYTAQISAPYRLDCALTYRVGEGSLQEDAPVEIHPAPAHQERQDRRLSPIVATTHEHEPLESGRRLVP